MTSRDYIISCDCTQPSSIVRITWMSNRIFINTTSSITTSWNRTRTRQWRLTGVASGCKSPRCKSRTGGGEVRGVPEDIAALEQEVEEEEEEVPATEPSPKVVEDEEALHALDEVA